MILFVLLDPASRRRHVDVPAASPCPARKTPFCFAVFSKYAIPMIYECASPRLTTAAETETGADHSGCRLQEGSR